MEIIHGPIDPVPRRRRVAPVRRFAKALATAPPVPPPPSIPGADMLVPGNQAYRDALVSFELRHILPPGFRAMCRETRAVAAMVNWLRQRQLPFAARNGGHSFAGFSQSDSVVIDVRPMNRVTVNEAARTVTVGAGASLGDIYRRLDGTGLGFAAGSCPPVGVSGHTLGGGMGLIGRRYGLACDNLLSLVLVTAQGNTLNVDAGNEPDLFWACRGGGGGSFGIVTELTFRLHPVQQVYTFGVSWVLAKAAATRLFDGWQRWAPSAPADISAIMKVGGRADGKVALRCIGQTVGDRATLLRELAILTNLAAPVSPPTVTARSFFQAVDHFSGGWAYETLYHKGKSDFLEGLSSPGIRALMDNLVAAADINLVAICDPYGGAIASIGAGATAFPHRGAASYCIQYYVEWSRADQTAERLRACRQFYAALRPFMPGRAYVNYCDDDLANWAEAYWGHNLPRLRQIKGRYDPANLFRHRQSIPLP